MQNLLKPKWPFFFSARGTKGIVLPLAKHVCWNHIQIHTVCLSFNLSFSMTRIEFGLNSFQSSSKNRFSQVGRSSQRKKTNTCMNRTTKKHSYSLVCRQFKDCYHVTMSYNPPESLLQNTFTMFHQPPNSFNVDILSPKNSPVT